MDELLEMLQSEAVELLFYEVFNGFDVVIGNGFYFFYMLGIGDGEIGVDAAQTGDVGIGQPFELREPCPRVECDEIEDFNFDAVAHERVFRKIVGQRFGFGMITAVDGRNGSKS